MKSPNVSPKKESPKSRKKNKNDPISRISSGLSLILLGVLFLLMTLDSITWKDWLFYTLIGLGSIMVLEVILRELMPGYYVFRIGKLIIGIIFIIIGSTSIYKITHWWPLIIIGIGIVVLLSSLKKK
ncbi:MAG: hypothetical protein ACOC6P_03730 [Candidatus Aminicenantaceae bacterium]